MADPLGWSGHALEKYGAYALGLLIGTGARYGQALQQGRKLTWRGFFGDLLLQGLLGCIAVAAGDVFGLTGNAQVFVGALTALNSDRLIRVVSDMFVRRVEDAGKALGATVSADSATVARLPAGSGEPESVEVQQPVEDKAVARVGAALRRAVPKDEKNPDAMRALLDKLGGADDL